MIAFSLPPADADKSAFHRYLTDFQAVDDDTALLDRLQNCSDILPARYAALLFLPPGSTYREAVQLLLCSWQVGDEHQSWQRDDYDASPSDN